MLAVAADSYSSKYNIELYACKIWSMMLHTSHLLGQ